MNSVMQASVSQRKTQISTTATTNTQQEPTSSPKKIETLSPSTGNVEEAGDKKDSSDADNVESSRSDTNDKQQNLSLQREDSGPAGNPGNVVTGGNDIEAKTNPKPNHGAANAHQETLGTATKIDSAGSGEKDSLPAAIETEEIVGSGETSSVGGEVENTASSSTIIISQDIEPSEEDGKTIVVGANEDDEEEFYDADS